MSERVHVNMTGVGHLVGGIEGAQRAVEEAAQDAAVLLSLARVDAGPARQAHAAAARLDEVERDVRRFLEQVRSLDQPDGYVIWTSAPHAAFADPRPSREAAQAAFEEMGRAFEFGLADGAAGRLIDLLATHEGDPVFALEVVRLAAGSSSGFGAALWAMEAAPRHQRDEVRELARRLGATLAVANRSAELLVTHDSVMADLGRATGGDAAQLAYAPLLFAATARAFTRSFLHDMVR
jgi:hypothetical protein